MPTKFPLVLRKLGEPCLLISVCLAISSLQAEDAVQTEFLREQTALSSEFSALAATPEKRAQWELRNAARLAAQQRRAVAMGEASVPAPLPVIEEMEIPASASKTMEDFLSRGLGIQNARAREFNGLLRATPAVREAAAENFERRNAAALQRWQEGARAVGEEAAREAVPLPPPLNLPANTPPRLQAFLVAQDRLMRASIERRNQLITATPAAREAALADWDARNAAALQALQQLAIALNPTP